MQKELLRFKKNQKYIVFDTETESLSLALARPWQLSWLICQNSKIIENQDHLLMWDDFKISADAARITRFDRNNWKTKAKTPLEVWTNFQKYLYNPDYLIIGANLFGFDIFILNTLMTQLGFKSDYSYIDRILDIQCLQKGIYGGLKSIPIDRTAWQYQMYHNVTKGVKTSVKHLCNLYQIDYDEYKAHDAVYDNIKCFEIFKKQINVIDI
jgi:DNA polymerase III alpha subunit (gram-positive type)